MTGVWGGFSVETEDKSSDPSRGLEPEDAQTEEECRLNILDLHTARLVFRKIWLERTYMWKIIILILIYGENKSKVLWWKERKHTVSVKNKNNTADYGWLFYKFPHDGVNPILIPGDFWF